MFGPAYVSDSESRHMYHGYFAYRPVPHRKIMRYLETALSNWHNYYAAK